MRKLNGFTLLTLSICCCIFVSLGYYKLFHGVSQNVNHPDTAEFWQVRTLALQLRSPIKEARLSFNNDDVNVFDIDGMIDPAAHKVADQTLDYMPEEPIVSQASLFFFSWLQQQDEALALQSSYNKYIDASSRFAMEYNRELTRMINSDR